MAAIRRIILQRPGLQIGLFRCAPSHPHFCDTGPSSGHLLVFPRTSVRIAQDGRTPVIADPTLVMLYNEQQRYRREPISALGDRCEFFLYAPELVREAIRPYDPGVTGRERELFLTPCCPGQPQAYLRQRRLVERLLARQGCDPLAVEEESLALLATVVAHAYRRAGSRPTVHSVRERCAARELADAVKAVLADSFHQPLTLAAISAQVHCSPFHLCRTFSAVVGVPVHRYLNRLRLHAALERIAQRRGELSGLALELGFSSHSHFTRLFREEFGVPPSQIDFSRPARLDSARM